MTKDDFLNQLSLHLKNIPQHDYNEIMEHFTEYFDDAGPDKEAQICQELGEPADVAEEIINTLDIKKIQPEKDWTDWDDDEPTPATWIEQKFSSITSLTFQLYTLNLDIFTDDIAQPTLSYYSEGDNITVNQNGGRLDIIENKLAQENSMIFSNLFVGRLLEKRQTITLILPKNVQISSIIGDSKNGDVSLNEVTCDSFVLISYNGNIEVSCLKNAHAKIKSKNGNIKLTNCQFIQSELETKNANLNCFECQLSNCQIVNKNGNIRTIQGSIQETQLENKNGNIIIEHTELTAKIGVENKNGFIDIMLTDDNLSHCQVKAQNKNGFVTISKQAGKALPTQVNLSLTNKNGMISLH